MTEDITNKEIIENLMRLARKDVEHLISKGIKDQVLDMTMKDIGGSIKAAYRRVVKDILEKEKPQMIEAVEVQIKEATPQIAEIVIKQMLEYLGQWKESSYRYDDDY